MEILILGGTGAMGSNLIKLLSDNEHSVTATSRSFQKSFKNVKFEKGNAKDILFLEELLKQKWDVIVDFMVYSTSQFKQRIDLLLNATSQYMFFSSARVYAESIEPLTEKSDRLLDISNDQVYLSTDEYSLAKARQEDILQNSLKKNWTIIRPYITYGNYRLQLGVLEKEDWLFRALKGKTIIFSKEINEKFTTMTFGLDVASGIERLLGNPCALGEIFHITHKDPIKWNEVLNIYLDVLEEHLGKRPKVILENFNRFQRFHPAIYQINYDRLYHRVFDNKKIAEYVEIENFISASDGLKRCLEEFLLNPKFKSINWRSEALKDRRAKEYTRLKEINGLKQKVKYIIYRYINI